MRRQRCLPREKAGLLHIVRTHPETGRRTHVADPHFTTRIVGVSEQESRALLDELFAQVERSGLHYRHRWQPHDNDV